jgi:hypothetical protein
MRGIHGVVETFTESERGPQHGLRRLQSKTLSTIHWVVYSHREVLQVPTTAGITSTLDHCNPF